MAAIEFRGKGLVFGAHHGIPMRALVLDTQASNLEPGQEPDNFVVEGKQLDALKALSSRFAGAVSVIYAVPPYNTGSDGWKYDDDIQTPLTVEWAKGGPVGRDDPDRHDKWLSWMTPRLRLMHELLADDGVLFVSIDDNEGFRLKLLLDEIFGESNALPTLVWQKRYSVPSDVKGIGFTHENILVYRKSERFAPQLVPQTEEQLERYNHVDPDGRRWKSADYTCRWTKQQRPNLYYAIKNPFTKKNVFPKRLESGPIRRRRPPRTSLQTFSGGVRTARIRYPLSRTTRRPYPMAWSRRASCSTSKSVIHKQPPTNLRRSCPVRSATANRSDCSASCFGSQGTRTASFCFHSPARAKDRMRLHSRTWPGMKGAERIGGSSSSSATTGLKTSQ